MFKYFPHTEEDIQAMLCKTGINSIDDLYADVPEEIRFRGDYQLPKACSESELRQLFDEMTRQTRPLTCFAGAGTYDHYAPAVVQDMVRRSEFLTSYTPYQAEVSQGTLHYIFEYQSMMARLTGMEISNASLYDGATATAEAAMMAVSSAKKADTVLLSETLDPKVAGVVRTYAHYHGINIETIPQLDGTINRQAMKQRLQQGGVAGVVVQMPNRYGIVEDLTGLADEVHEQKALLVVNSVAADLALLKTPGEWGADIAVGDGQSLGLPMSFGGPGIGYMCCKEKLMRKMPGRIVGMTQDNRGQRAFVLTLQAREQHIRRQKATSNICSNQSLMALYVTIYLSLMGPEGLKEAAELSYAGAHYLCEQLVGKRLGQLTYQKPFFNEFCMTFPGMDADIILSECADRGIIAGVKVDSDKLLIAVTEQRTRSEIDKLVETIGNIKKSGENVTNNR